MSITINSHPVEDRQVAKNDELSSKRTPGFIGTTWRSILVAAGYVFSLVASGVVTSLLGFELATSESGIILLLTFIAGFMLAFFIGPLAVKMAGSRWRQATVWFSVVFFNMGSVAIEGAYFAPELVPMPLPILFIQQVLASTVVAVLVTLLFSRPATSPSIRDSLRLRPWNSWVWRFLASCLTYLLAYFAFGALNYSLVTQPFYETHTGGLNVPPPELVLSVEALRAPLIILSIGFFVISFAATQRRLALTTGILLFWVGGLVPLVLQVGTLPAPLLLASGVEIFFQNTLTGVVAAGLLHPPFSVPQRTASPQHTSTR